MFEGLGLDERTTAQLQAELKADFSNKDKSLDQIEQLLPRLKENVAAAGDDTPAVAGVNTIADISKKSYLKKRSTKFLSL